MILMLALPLMVLTACEKGVAVNPQHEGPSPETPVDGHGLIVLGERLDNPYATANMREAFASLYPTRSRDVIATTHLYVRFLPEDGEELEILESSGIDLFDYPLDYEILVDGDYYVDPQLPEGSITWQYAVVDKDFDFPPVAYEVIEECCLAESDVLTRSQAIDVVSLEREAFRLTGNEAMLAPLTRGSKNIPKGRLSVSDANYKGGEAVGIAGVRVTANSFVKIASGYTDEDGNYELNKSFSSANIKYRIVFKNESGFAIGFNLVLVPASAVSLGKHPSEGIDRHFTFDGDFVVWRRANVNNAVYEYWQRCLDGGSEILPPPSDLRLWLIDSMSDDFTLMLHHGAVWDNSFISSRLPLLARVLKFFSPDVLLGVKDCDSALDLYEAAYHEMAHASHYAQVGKAYWNDYAKSLVINALSGVGLYGTGEGSYDGYAGMAEMWAHYYSSRLFDDRYNLDFVFGEDCWFRPQGLRALENAGLSRESVFALFTSEVNGLEALENRILNKFGEEYLECFRDGFENGLHAGLEPDGDEQGEDDPDEGGQGGGSDDGPDDGGLSEGLPDTVQTVDDDDDDDWEAIDPLF